MKSVLISIQPKWCEFIAHGKKTIEVRKSAPKLDVSFKCFIYCTSVKSLPLEEYVALHSSTGGLCDKWSGRVIGEFLCDRIEEFHEWQLTPYGKFRDSEEEDLQKFLKDSCLSRDEVFAYRENLEYYQPLYGWHISELKIYDKPKPLSAFARPLDRANCGAKDCGFLDGKGCKWINAVCSKRTIKTPPQSWCYVEEMGL